MQRGWPVVVFILSLLVLVALAAGPVRADEAHGAADHKPGIFDWALDLGVWTLVVFLATNFRSTSETLGVGTRTEIPSSLPFNSGSTRPIALAAPVEVGIIDIAAARPR